MADFILNKPSHFFARVFGNPAGDPVLLKSRGVTLLRDTPAQASGFFFLTYSKCSVICSAFFLFRLQLCEEGVSRQVQFRSSAWVHQAALHCYC